jgi:hypothetical protein
MNEHHPFDLSTLSGIDVVGDVHGRATALRALLSRMGYSCRSGIWSHPERKAVFLGDLVDKGTEQVAAIDIVRRMVDAGEAVCCMGNHELNAIGYSTPDGAGGHLRRRSPSNKRQALAFLREVTPDSELHRDLVGWFQTLPIWLRVGNLRFVHACWHEPSIAAFPDGRFPVERLPALFNYAGGEPVGETLPLEILLKGPEIELPQGVSFLDQGGKARTRTRIGWWNETAGSLHAQALLSDDGLEALRTVPPMTDYLPVRDGILFFGHYWLEGLPEIASKHVVCCDYPGAGDLISAYRWNAGETDASSGNFIRSAG